MLVLVKVNMMTCNF